MNAYRFSNEGTNRDEYTDLYVIAHTEQEAWQTLHKWHKPLREKLLILYPSEKFILQGVTKINGDVPTILYPDFTGEVVIKKVYNA